MSDKTAWKLTWKDPEIIVSGTLFLFAISPAIVGMIVAWG